ncbi:MAG: short chain dehydrogenase [Bacteroidetes bacterium 4572_77]|nr:MAG: short chain dehydrogenase [Bacteroidetes bacterium 4572_77]
MDGNNKKVVVITGASSGIGKALAYEYAQQNFQVVIAARNLNSLQAIEKDLKENNAECLAVKTDVTIEKECENLIEESVRKFGKIDVFINNAGISMRARFVDLKLEVIEKIMNVNFWGTVYCTKYAMPYLLKTKGSLVGVISIAGYMGLPGRSAYSASKYAVRGFLDTLRIESRAQGVHVLVAAPGFTASNIRSAALDAHGNAQGKSPRKEEKMMSAEKVAVKIRQAIQKRKPELILTFLEGKLAVFLKKTFPRYLDRLVLKQMAKEPDSPLKNSK